MIQLALALTEPASDRIEHLIATTCPSHPGTTLSADGRCDVCVLVSSRSSPRLVARYKHPYPDTLLTPRQITVLAAVAEGKANKEVAHELGITERTVKNHVGSILRALTANNRTQAVLRAIHAGWIAMPK